MAALETTLVAQNGGEVRPSILTGSDIFREPFLARLRRWVLGSLYALRPRRLSTLPHVLAGTLCFMLFGEEARAKGSKGLISHSQCAGGLVRISNDLSVNALIAAYREGQFPLCHIGPMKWWSPETRAVLVPAEAHVSKKVRQLLRTGKYKVTFDQDFAGVIRACAEPRPGKTPLTWITPRIMAAYHDLHLAGYAHSVEVWDRDGKLVGGLYGVAAGDVFFGESQFSAADHASKVAVAVLHDHLARWGFVLRDAKFMTDHLETLGFKMMPRTEFMEILKCHAQKPDRRGKWSVDVMPDVPVQKTSAKTAERAVKTKTRAAAAA